MRLPTSARRAFSSSSAPKFYEWRTDTLLSRVPLTATGVSLEPEAGRLAAFKTEVGGATNEVHRLFEWDSYDSRDSAQFVLPQHAGEPLISSTRCGGCLYAGNLEHGNPNPRAWK